MEGLQGSRLAEDSLNNLRTPPRGWIRGWHPFAVAQENVLPRSMGGIPASPEPPAEEGSDGAEFVRPPPPWEEPPLPKETIPDALGMPRLSRP